MLRAAINELSPNMCRFNPLAVEEMKWFLGQIDRLEEDRNNAIHAPLASFSDPIWQSLAEAMGRPPRFTPGVHPDDIRYNKRAGNLRNKHILTEYRYVRDTAIAFRDYAEEVQGSWNWVENDNDNDPWPERPQLPNRGQKTPPKARRSQKEPSTQLPLRLKSSQE